VAEESGAVGPVYGPPSSMETLWNVNPQKAMLVEAETLENFHKKAEPSFR
jgi:hypothetical protein